MFSMTLNFWKRWKFSPGSREDELISFHTSNLVALIGENLRQDFLLKPEEIKELLNNSDLPHPTFWLHLLKQNKF